VRVHVCLRMYMWVLSPQGTPPPPFCSLLATIGAVLTLLAAAAAIDAAAVTVCFARDSACGWCSLGVGLGGRGEALGSLSCSSLFSHPPSFIFANPGSPGASK
jgi:hypothetical protein